MSAYIILTDTVLCLVLIIASVTDLRSGRVPNRLILAGAAALLLLKTGAPAAGAAFPEPEAMAAAVMIAVILLFLRRIGALGGGDVKLLLLILLAEPSERGLRMVAAAFAAGGVWSLAVMLKRGILRERMERLYAFLREPSLAEKAYHDACRDDAGAVIPFAPAICAGVLLFIVLS